MKYPRAAFINRILIIVIILIIFAPLMGSLLLAPISAQAHPSNTAGWSLTLKLANGPSFTYRASAAPIFTGVLTVPVGTSVDSVQFAIAVVGETTLNPGGLHQTSPTTYSYTADSDWSQLAAGTLTATAYYSTDATSNSLTFTANKDSTSLQCQIAYLGTAITTPSTALTVAVTPQATYAGIGPSDGTYTITFLDAHGATVSTFPNLSMDSHDLVSGITAPAQYGVYKTTCAYSGTQNFAPAQGNSQTLIVSQEQAITGAQLYTNPTTLQNNQRWQAYVVLNGQAGGPTPTGFVDIVIPQCYAPAFPVGPNGETLAQLPPITGCPPYQGIYVSYSGDPYYKNIVFTFPLTNPAIPASVLGGAAGSTPTSTGQGQTPQGQKSPTSGSQGSSVTATATASAAAANAGFAGPADAGTTALSSGGSPMLWLLIVVLVIVVGGGGVVAFFLVSRRAKPPTRGSTVTSNPASTQPPWPRHQD